jgi:hypothetical protein
MEMTVNTRNNGFIRMQPELLDRLHHLFMAFASINGDYAFRATDKGLIRQAITNVTPSRLPDSIKSFGQPVRVGKVLRVGNLPVGTLRLLVRSKRISHGTLQNRLNKQDTLKV